MSSFVQVVIFSERAEAARQCGEMDHLKPVAIMIVGKSNLIRLHLDILDQSRILRKEPV